MAEPKITKIQVHYFESELPDVGLDPTQLNPVYVPGGKFKRKSAAIRIFTDVGLIGEYASRHTLEFAALPMIAHYLIGSNPLQRERIYSDLKRALRQVARIGIAPVDNALWDLAGRFYDAPIHQLLGGYKQSLPCYASTYHGDTHGGLSRPEDYAEFAQRCAEMGYPGFKIHGWGRGVVPISQEVATVRAVGRQIGDKMDLMLDPACEYTTFAEAVKVGRACDEHNFFWYEDPFRDGTISQFAHRKLRQLIRTPLLITEHVRSLEPHVDFALAEGTDFVRGDARHDGITGVMKLAHACEALGLDIELHGAGPDHRQCMAAIRNTNYYEMTLVHPKAPSLDDVPLYKDGYRDALDAVDEHGCVPVPQGPGLGVEIDWDWLAAHRTGLVEYE